MKRGKEENERERRSHTAWWLGLTVATAVPLLVAAWVEQNALRRAINPLVGTQLQTTLQLGAAAVTERLDANRRLSRRMGARISKIPKEAWADELPTLIANIDVEREVSHVAVTIGAETSPSVQFPAHRHLADLRRFNRMDDGEFSFALTPGDGRAFLVVEAPLEVDSGGKVEVLFEIGPIEALLERSRVGASGETYLVTPDGRLASSSRFDESLHRLGLLEPGVQSFGLPLLAPDADLTAGEEPGPVSGWRPTLAAAELMAGRDGMNIEGYRDYRGVMVVGAWAWLDASGIGIVSEIDKSEALAPLADLERSLIETFVVISVVVVVGYFLALAISRRLERRRVRREVADLAERAGSAEAQFETIFQKAPIGLALLNEAGEVVRANTKLMEILAATESEVIGTQITAWLASGAKSVRNLPPAPKLDEGHMGIACTIRTGARRTIHALLEVTATVNGGADFFRVASLQDVSEARLAQWSLQNLKDRHKAALVEAGIGVFEVQPAEGVVIFHGTLRQLLGLDSSKRELSVESALQYVHPDDRSRVARRWTANRESTENDLVLDCRMVRSDGEIREVALRSRAVADGSGPGQQQRLIGTAHDQTEQRRLLTELMEARAQAETADASKTRFLSNVSHELRTPLNAIQGFAQLLQRDRSLGVEQRGLVDQILSGATKLSRLVDEVIEFSKVDGGGEQVRTEVVDLPAFLDELSRVFGTRASTKGLAWGMDAAADLPTKIRIDQAKFRRVIGKVVDNAVKFTKSGKIDLSVKTREMGGKPWLTVDVRDTGPGIAKEDLQLIFREFEQSGGAGQGSGLGLGLSLARALTRRMGGEITIDSKNGRGTCVRLEIPYEAVSAIPEKKKRTNSQEVPVPKKRDWEVDKLPNGLVANLRECVQVGDLDGLVGQLDQVDQHSPELAEHLRQAVGSLDYGELTQVLANPSEP